MTACFTRSRVKDHTHSGVPITTSIYGQNIVFPVSSVINQFILGPKLFGIESDGGTNLARCKAMLESNFDIAGVFDLGKLMFVMECLPYVLENACNAGIMYVKLDDGQVDTQVTSNNMQCCTTWEKSQKVSKALEAAQNNLGLPSRRLTTTKKIV